MTQGLECKCYPKQNQSLMLPLRNLHQFIRSIKDELLSEQQRIREEIVRTYVNPKKT